jgi:hypothetical protein
LSLHQQVFTVISAAQDDVINAAYVHQLAATGLRNGALQVFLHFTQSVFEVALDGLGD